TANTKHHTLSLHDALPICMQRLGQRALGLRMQAAHFRMPGPAREQVEDTVDLAARPHLVAGGQVAAAGDELPCQRPLLALAFQRSEEHTSELQSRENLVCR